MSDTCHTFHGKNIDTLIDDIVGFYVTRGASVTVSYKIDGTDFVLTLTDTSGERQTVRARYPNPPRWEHVSAGYTLEEATRARAGEDNRLACTVYQSEWKRI
jgi:hypothetical protein